MVGICAGERKGTRKGDIIIPGKVASISNGKVIDGYFKSGNRFHSIDDDLRKDVSSFVEVHWKKLQKELIERWDKAFIDNKKNLSLTKNQQGNWPKLHFEEKLVMAQVFHVLAYSESFDDLKSYASREVIALEMESAALAYTVEKMAAPKSKWLIIKGVQDYADGTKDHRFREFCSWVSFSVLTSFLQKYLRELWNHKVNLSNQKTNRKHLVSHDLEEAYRIGNFDLTTEIGRKAHRASPSNAKIWRTYIRALLRKQMYTDAAEVIDIADYYVAEFAKMGKPLTFDVHSSYLLGKADFFRRIGKIEDSEIYVESILNEAQSYRLGKNNNVAEALHLKGRIAMKRFEDSSRTEYLKEAENYFNNAFCMTPSKYWAGTLFLLAKHLQGENIACENGVICDVMNTIQKNIKDTPLRPVPRIYMIRLNALLIAANIKSFSYLQRIINKDISEYSSSIFIPDCFFVSLENDCRIMFHRSEQRHSRDELLSKIYYWASKMRKG